MISSVFLVRHGETAWSKAGKHTGRSEIPLSEQGELNARSLAGRLSRITFGAVLSSPRQRARRTCELSGVGGQAITEPDLSEWDYGDYEGLTSAEILRSRPGWILFRDGCPGGESPAQVSERADRLVSKVRALDGNVALFTHGHFGRVLAVRWVGMAVASGERLMLDPASVSTLSYEHGNPAAPVISLWNEPPVGTVL